MYMVSYWFVNKWFVFFILVVKLFNVVSKYQKEMESKLKLVFIEAKKLKGERL